MKTKILFATCIFSLFAVNLAYGRWPSVDRYAEKYYSTSPYAYTLDNPIRYNDHNGDSTVISGAERGGAVQQLQTRLGGQLNISSSSSGAIVATPIPGVRQTRESRQAMRMFGDNSITVNIVAENTNTTSTGNLYVGGAFMGNAVTNTNGTVTVVANQEVNPQVLGALSTANGVPGQDMLHEVTEAYQGAVISQRSGVSSPGSGNRTSVYEQAHNRAVNQSGVVVQTVYDAKGNIVQSNNPAAAKAEFSTTGANGQRVIIMTFP